MCNKLCINFVFVDNYGEVIVITVVKQRADGHTVCAIMNSVTTK